MSVCDVCNRELVPFAGTYLCPTAVEEIENYEADVKWFLEGMRRVLEKERAK
jgi:hypothetical protein